MPSAVARPEDGANRRFSGPIQPLPAVPRPRRWNGARLALRSDIHPLRPDALRNTRDTKTRRVRNDHDVTPSPWRDRLDTSGRYREETQKQG